MLAASVCLCCYICPSFCGPCILARGRGLPPIPRPPYATPPCESPCQGWACPTTPPPPVTRRFLALKHCLMDPGAGAVTRRNIAGRCAQRGLCTKRPGRKPFLFYFQSGKVLLGTSRGCPGPNSALLTRPNQRFRAGQGCIRVQHWIPGAKVCGTRVARARRCAHRADADKDCHKAGPGGPVVRHLPRSLRIHCLPPVLGISQSHSPPPHTCCLNPSLPTSGLPCRNLQYLATLTCPPPSPYLQGVVLSYLVPYICSWGRSERILRSDPAQPTVPERKCLST